MYRYHCAECAARPADDPTAERLTTGIYALCGDCAEQYDRDEQEAADAEQPDWDECDHGQEE